MSSNMTQKIVIWSGITSDSLQEHLYILHIAITDNQSLVYQANVCITIQLFHATVLMAQWLNILPDCDEWGVDNHCIF